jgi:hypothetical protein
MIDALLNLLFGCSHNKITFPLTPAWHMRSANAGPGLQRHGTYVVCLECCREFQYDWQGMRMGEPVRIRPCAPAVAESFSLATQQVHTAGL